MKRWIWMVLAGVFIAAGSAQAHCGNCGTGDAPKAEQQDILKEHLDMMTKDLALSEAQRSQLEVIMKEKMEKRKQLVEQQQAAMVAFKDEYTAKMKAILNEEQMKKWEETKDNCPICKRKGSMGNCPDCKDGKPCKACKHKKGKGKRAKDKGEKAAAYDHHGHDHK